MQEDIELFVSRAKPWGLKFNAGKTRVLWFCCGAVPNLEPYSDYYMNGQAYTIGLVESASDLGILVDCSLNFYLYITKFTNKAGEIASNLLKSTINTVPVFVSWLYCTDICPVTEPPRVVWLTGCERDITLLEKVQRRWTKQIVGLSNLDYAIRLATLSLYSLSGGSLRINLIKVWTFLNGLSPIQPSDIFVTT